MRYLPFDVDMFVELLNIATDYDKEEYLKAGERTWNLTKIFNVKNGFNRKDETVPERILSEKLEINEAVI